MAAALKPKDPLDALPLLLNDVLVQIGKALRASRRDSQGNLVIAQGLSQSKLTDMIQNFHTALDDIESNIMTAKSVILRDLNQLQADQNTGQQSHLQPALPIESQANTSFAVHLDSSSPPPPPPPPLSSAPAAKPASAPFPVMTAQDMTKGDVDANIEEKGVTSHNNNMTGNIAKMAPEGAPEAPMAANANFTDMEFSLAPADGLQGQTAGTRPLDISSSAAAPPPNGTMMSLDGLLPNNGQGTDAMTTGPPPMTGSDASRTEPPAPDGGGISNDAHFDDFFGNDASQTDGMDFDFSIGGSGSGAGAGADGGSGGVGVGGAGAGGAGGGAGGVGGAGAGTGGMDEDTFDDLMNDRDGTLELMSNDAFDAAFF